MRFNVMSIPTLLGLQPGRSAEAPRGRQGQGPTPPGAERIPAYFPLTPGQRGEAIRDLQRRLGAAGFTPAAGAEAGVFCAATEARHCERSSRPVVCMRDGICDEHTWTALVEASWKPGDRQLLLTSPNLRGDDVADLQSRLARLGFDCGRVDGIFGPRTSRALADFQSNCGVLADGVCGPDTVARSSCGSAARPAPAQASGAVRERERLRTGFESLANCRVVVGQFGGLSGLTRTLARELRQRGATVMPLDEPDAVAQALAANHFGAHVYVGFQGHDRAGGGRPLLPGAGVRVGRRSRAGRTDRRASCRVVPGLEPAASGMRLAGPARDPDAGGAAHRWAGAGRNRCDTAAGSQPSCGRSTCGSYAQAEGLSTGLSTRCA